RRCRRAAVRALAVARPAARRRRDDRRAARCARTLQLVPATRTDLADGAREAPDRLYRLERTPDAAATLPRPADVDDRREDDVDGARVVCAGLAIEDDFLARAASGGRLAGEKAACRDVQALVRLGSDEVESLLGVEPDHRPAHQACPSGVSGTAISSA